MKLKRPEKTVKVRPICGLTAAPMNPTTCRGAAIQGLTAAYISTLVLCIAGLLEREGL